MTNSVPLPTEGPSIRNIPLTGNYRPDLLKDGFEQQTIYLPDDYEGAVTATLIRRLSSNSTPKAVLYVHGFNDYFFQKELAYRFNEHQFNFYALDLRKYGRSYLPHQKFNDIRNIPDYYEEIRKALAIIRQEGNEKTILMGHSTGGLILTSFAKDHPGSSLFDALILNSPFYKFNKNPLIKMIISVISGMGNLFSNLKVSSGLTEDYGKSLHQSSGGEWEYNLNWKPHQPPKVTLGWIRAIYKAQKKLFRPFKISCPVLVMHSSKSVFNSGNKDLLLQRDAVLNVKDIESVARRIQGNATIVSIEGGLHDLILSPRPVREKVYNTIFDWIKRYVP